MKFTRLNTITFDSLDSTNDYAKAHLHEFSHHLITCIVAKKQTKGHGQYNRPWISPEGGLYVTFAFHLYNEPIEKLAQLLSHLVIEILHERGVRATFKEPNDILVSGKKAGGVLCEATTKNGHTQIALGLGLNLSTKPHLLDTVNQPATSLSIKDHDQFLSQLQDRFLQQLDRGL